MIDKSVGMIPQWLDRSDSYLMINLRYRTRLLTRLCRRCCRVGRPQQCNHLGDHDGIFEQAPSSPCAATQSRIITQHVKGDIAVAQRTIVQLTDDLDGKAIPDSRGETGRFGLDRQDYEIDLSDTNSRAVRDALSKYVAARRVGSSRGGHSRAGRSGGAQSRDYDPKAVRAWARAARHRGEPARPGAGRGDRQVPGGQRLTRTGEKRAVRVAGAGRGRPHKALLRRSG